MLHVDQDFLLVLSAIFSSGWRIATAFKIPGTNINVPEFVFACMMIVFVLRIVPGILGISSLFQGSSDTGNTSQNDPDGNTHDVGRW